MMSQWKICYFLTKHLRESMPQLWASIEFSILLPEYKTLSVGFHVHLKKLHIVIHSQWFIYLVFAQALINTFLLEGV